MGWQSTGALTQRGCAMTNLNGGGYAASLVVCALGMLFSPPGVTGQAGQPVAPGDRVRVAGRGVSTLPTTATFAGWHGDTLLLDVTGGSRLAVPRGVVTSFEVSRGKKSKVATGALVGLLVGSAATGVFLAAFCSDPDTLCEADEVWRAFALIALPATAVGTAIGLAVRVERWEALPVSQLLPQGAGAQRLQVGLTWRF
jgi:hypothetical protein